MTKRPKFLIHYPPGARGDFFGSFLTGQTYNLTKYFKMPVDLRLVAKTHDLKEVIYTELHPLAGWLGEESVLNRCKEVGAISISVTTDTFEERMDTLYFHRVKNRGATNIPGRIAFGEVHDVDQIMASFTKETDNFKKSMDMFFEPFAIDTAELDYCIPFNDLFDIDKLVDFYQRIYSKMPSDMLIAATKTNIEKNLRFTKSTYYEDFLKKIT